MAKVIAGMTMSIDGYVTDAQGNAGELYPDLESLRDTAHMVDTIAQTGAVLMGRKTFDMGDPDSYVGNYEFQVPIFVLTHQAPPVAPRQDEHLTFTFVTDGLESAVRPVTAAAGDKAVQVVGGVDVIRQLLQAGAVDELQIDVMPVLLGEGLRFSPDGSNPSTVRVAKVRWEKVSVQEIGARTSMLFRAVR